MKLNFLIKEEKVNGKAMRRQDSEIGKSCPITSFVIIKVVVFKYRLTLCFASKSFYRFTKRKIYVKKTFLEYHLIPDSQKKNVLETV